MYKLYIARVSEGRTVTQAVLKIEHLTKALLVRDVLNAENYLTELREDGQLPSWEIATLAFHKAVKDPDYEGGGDNTIPRHPGSYFNE